MNNQITGSEIIRMSHKHGCKPVVFPNGALNIEGTLENLTSLWRAFWTRRFSPRFVTDERVDGQTVPGFSPRIEIHPQVALRKAKVKDGIPVGPSRGPCFRTDIQQYLRGVR